jgi:hypothetical protein
MTPNPAPQPARPLVFPLLLIVIGGLFLYANWEPGFSAWRVLGVYWPLILILLGLGKIWDNTRRGGASQSYSSGLTVGVLVFVLVIAVLLWHGRSFAHGRRYSGTMQHSSQTVERGGAKSVRADIEMAAGQLTIGGGSASLLEAKFDERENEGPPEVEYSQDNGEGELKISEVENGPHIGYPGRGDTNWDLRFGSGAPLELKINIGAGRGDLHLRGLPVTRLDLNMGAGRVEADLSGDRKQDLTADIEGGVGEAVIHLPRNVGVIVEASGGIGGVDTHGLRREGDRYVNEAYGKTPATIHLKVQGGIGHIALTEE